MDTWMYNLPESRKLAPLTALKIPGSHDSGAYKLDVARGLANDQNFSPFVRRLSKNRFVRHVVKRWSETQRLNVVEQLNAGVRYLDVRLELLPAGKNEDEPKPTIVHGLYGERGVDFLNGVMEFVKKTPHEVIILDVNHVYKMSALDFVTYISSMLLQVFPKELICPINLDFTKVSLKWLIDKGIRVVIVGPYLQAINHFIYGDTTIESLWPNKNNIRALMQFLREEILQPAPTHLHVLQGVVTPRAYDIVLHAFSSLKSVFSDKATSDTLNLINGLRDTEREKINIVLADQVDKEFCAAVVALNT